MANPVFVKTTDSYIAALMKVTLNAATGNTYLNQFRNFVTENGGGNTGLQKLGSALANYASTDNAAFAATVVANLGITGESATAAKTNVKTLLDSYGADRGKALMQLVDIMVNLQADTTWGATANAFVNSVNTGHQYSVNTANTSTDLTVLSAVMGVTNGAVTGQNFTLTTGADTFNGNAGADILRGVAGAAIGQQDQTTLNSSDVLDGAAGEDKLVVLLNGNYGGGATIKNIETLQIGQNVGGATAFDYNVNNGVYEVTSVNTVVYDQITAGETLNVNNITPSATGTTVPTLHWANENGSAAGVAGATYRQASIAGTTDNQQVILENVTGGDLNIARGIETITVTSSGTVTANTLSGVDAADGTVVDLVSENQGGNAVNDDSTLTKVVVKGEKAFGTAATVNTNDAAGEAGYGLTNRAANGLGDLGNSAHAASASNLISVAATVTEIDATEANGGVAMRFTPRVDGNAVNVTFKGGKAADYVEFVRGNANATGGEGADTFAFLNSNLTNFDFGSADSLTGGTGSDTIQLGVNGNGTVVANTTEFNNKTGIDVLDLRGAVNTVTLADAFVAGADAGTFTVRTDKIVQTSSASTANTTPSNAANNAALENNSVNTVVLTELADNRALEFIGGSGSDRVVVDNASANQFTKLDGGTNAAAGSNDSLTVVNTAVLDGNDVASIKGFELLNLVENTNGNNSFNVTISEAFLLANSTTAVNLTIASVTNTYGQRLGAGDVVNLEISDLLSAGVAKASIANRVVNVQDLIAANVTVNFQQNGVTVSTNAAPAALAANLNLATAPAATVLDDVPGAVAAAAALALTSASANVAAGTITGGASTADTLTLTDAGGAAAIAFGANVTAVENLVLANGTNNFTFNAANVFNNITGGTGADTLNINNLPLNTSVSLGDGADNLTVQGTRTGGTLAGGNGADTLTLGGAANLVAANISGFETLVTGGNNVTLSTAQFAGFAAVNGTGTITFNDNASATHLAGGTSTTFQLAAGGQSFTGNAAVNYGITGGAGNDSITLASVDTNDVVNGGAGVDTFEITNDVVAGAGVNVNDLSNIEVITVTADQTNGNALTLTLTSDVTATSGAGSLAVNINGGASQVVVAYGAGSTVGAAITGSTGADTITGGAQADTIVGGDGDDIVINSAGADRITLGAGNDQVTMSTANDTYAAGVKVITDFTSGAAASNDLIVLDMTTDATNSRATIATVVTADGLTIMTAGLTTAEITSGIAAAAAANNVIVVFNTSTSKGEMWFDADWTDTTGRTQIATFDNITTLVGVTGLSAVQGVDFNIV